MSAALLETFAAGNRIVRFTPQGPDDVESYQHRIHRLLRIQSQRRFSVFYSYFRRAVSAVGIAKVYWQQAEEVDVQEFNDLTQDELDMILAEDDVELIDSETDDIGLQSGTIGITRDANQVVIEPVAQEGSLSSNKLKAMDAKFCAHQTREPLSELRDMGFTDEQLDKIGDHEHMGLDTSQKFSLGTKT